MRPLYSFSAGNSSLHRLDARTKLTMVFSYLGLALLLPNPWILFVILVVVVWVFAKISLMEYYGFLLLMAPIIIGITLVHTMIIGGAPYLFSIPIGSSMAITVSEAGLLRGSTLAFRLATMGLAFTVFSMTTEPFVWGMSMYKAGLNYKFAFMFGFAMRFFPLFQEEFIVVQNALKARGSNALTSINPFNPYRFFRGMAIATVPMALSAVRRSQEIALAMELRGLNIPEEEGITRTLYRHIELRKVDYLMVGFSLTILATVVLWRIATSYGWF